MKKLLIAFLALAYSSVLMAGGLVTNTNQSAMFTRFQCRDASLDIDAAFYNPAGLVHLNNGFYLSLNNQVMGQLKMITIAYDRLNEEAVEYEGKITNPFFPGIYSVYKSGRFAFSIGVNPITGDGVTKFAKGLPSNDIILADKTSIINSTLSSTDDELDLGSVRYDGSDQTIESKLLTMGYQANVSFQLNDYISFAAGLRIVNSRNTTRGSVSNITWEHTTNAGTTERVSPVPFTEATVSNIDLNDTSVAGGITRDDLNDAIDEIRSWESITDVSFAGSGVTPVLSINYAPSLTTNWAIRYEFKTSIDLITKVHDGKDGNGKYVDGNIVVVDIPAMFSVGVTKMKGHRFKYFAGIHYYFDNPINFDGSKLKDIEIIVNNTTEVAFGAEYLINNKYRASAGIRISKPGVHANYYNEERFAGDSYTLGTGFGIRLSPLIDFNIGASYTMYKMEETNEMYVPTDGVNLPANLQNIQDSRGWVISAGIDFVFGEL